MEFCEMKNCLIFLGRKTSEKTLKEEEIKQNDLFFYICIYM